MKSMKKVFLKTRLAIFILLGIQVTISSNLNCPNVLQNSGNQGNPRAGDDSGIELVFDQRKNPKIACGQCGLTLQSNKHRNKACPSDVFPSQPSNKTKWRDKIPYAPDLIVRNLPKFMIKPNNPKRHTQAIRAREEKAKRYDRKTAKIVEEYADDLLKDNYQTLMLFMIGKIPDNLASTNENFLSAQELKALSEYWEKKASGPNIGKPQHTANKKLELFQQLQALHFLVMVNYCIDKSWYIDNLFPYVQDFANIKYNNLLFNQGLKMAELHKPDLQKYKSTPVKVSVTPTQDNLSEAIKGAIEPMVGMLPEKLRTWNIVILPHKDNSEAQISISTFITRFTNTITVRRGSSDDIKNDVSAVKKRFLYDVVLEYACGGQIRKLMLDKPRNSNNVGPITKKLTDKITSIIKFRNKLSLQLGVNRLAPEDTTSKVKNNANEEVDEEEEEEEESVLEDNDTTKE